ncbi:hypothetical protein FQN57_006623 [Myotisia sp. PD_48]|nr:hypothetical protein FQN57_006623 [Myotisia sp. PD_48]
MQACDRCHRRKSRCDKESPSCGSCIKAGIACSYTDRSKEPTYRKEVVERLERRLRQSEATNRALAARLAAATQKKTQQNGYIDDNGRINLSPHLHADNMMYGESQPIKQEGENNEVTDEVSYLSLTAGGDRQFLGSASGVLFANLVRATVETSPVPISTTAVHSSNVGSSPSSSNPGRETTMSGGRSGLSLPPDARASNYQLPPEPFARDLHHAYFEHDHLCYPFLHRPTALAAFEQIYDDPSILNRDALSCFVFYMILAISSVDFHKFDWQTKPDADNFHSVALSRLNEVLQTGNFETLQAILLLCQYRMRSPLHDTSASMWHLVGVAARICIDQGLHREATYRIQQTMSGIVPSLSSEDIRSEVKRRCFFCVMAMDRVVSSTLGRPVGIRLADTDVLLPNPDFDLEVNPLDTSFRPTTDTFSRTALFVHIVRYRFLIGKILGSLYSVRAKNSTSDEASALSIRESLVADLEQWRQETASLNLPAVDLSSTIPGDRSSFRAHEWYELLYYNAILILYRPSPALSASSTMVPILIQTIYNAAKQAITLYAHLHRSRRINYTWITLHAVFMAGLSYIYAVGRHFRSKRRAAIGGPPAISLDEDPSIIEIVNETRACSTVLVAVSERWSAIRRSHEVFNRLSDAVLSDAVELLNDISPGRIATPMLPITAPEVTLPVSLAMSPSSLVTAHPGFEHWSSFTDTIPTAPQLAVDSVLQDCFRDLQQMPEYSYDPISQLSQDWLGEIGDAFKLCGE